MKKISIILAIILSCLFFSPELGARFVEVQVTEAIPGANCGSADSDGVITCRVQAGFGSVMTLAGEIIKYFTYITALACVLFIVINGILYSMSGINDGLKSAAKDRIFKTLIGLIILMLSGVILNAIAPWIYR